MTILIKSKMTRRSARRRREKDKRKNIHALCMSIKECVCVANKVHDKCNAVASAAKCKFTLVLSYAGLVFLG